MIVSAAGIVTADADIDEGEGTSEKPYVIKTWSDLDKTRNELNANYTLGNDLNSSTAGYDSVASPSANDGKGFDPIGDDGNPFTGSFDGTDMR